MACSAFETTLFPQITQVISSPYLCNIQQSTQTSSVSVDNRRITARQPETGNLSHCGTGNTFSVVISHLRREPFGLSELLQRAQFLGAVSPGSALPKGTSIMSGFPGRPLQAFQASLVLLFLILPNVVGDCTGKQSYVVTLTMSFTQDKDPSIPPAEDASVPIVVGVSHTSDFFLFRNTRVVDDAIAEVARTRRSDKIAEKLDDLKSQGSVRSYFILEDVPIDDISQLEVTVEGEATLVSIMAPVSPSPAWFVGVDSYNVCKDSALVLEDRGILVKTYRSGLEKGESWTGKGVPVELKNALPVEEVENSDRIAALAIEQGTLGVNWWKILLGVLAGVAVLIILVIFIYPRCRRKKPTDIPLTTQEEIDW